MLLIKCDLDATTLIVTKLNSAKVAHIMANLSIMVSALDEEMLSKISKTCLSINSSEEQLVAVNRMNKVKRGGKTVYLVLADTRLSGNTKKDKNSANTKNCCVQHSKLYANYELNVLSVMCTLQSKNDNENWQLQLKAGIDAFLTVVEPKTYKDALPQACWIEAIQEELNEFKQLEVWELIPRPHKPVVYRQEEGYRFDESFALGVSVYEAYKDFLRIAAHMNMVLYLKWMISQSLEGIFITVKYALESLMNTVLTSCDLVDTPNGWKKIQLDEDKKGKSRRSVNTINAFADADHAGCQDTRVAF
ncbi:hypothetical protein Tco_0450491 [Tanacetum coccineum]